jgi:uncharacterized membrane protein
MQNKTSMSDRIEYRITRILTGFGIVLITLLTFVKIWTGSIFYPNGVNMYELMMVFIMDVAIMSICVLLAVVCVYYIKKKIKNETTYF